jgi:acyl dehydratase
MGDYYFEDYRAGQRFVTAGATVSEAQILDFALKYDPQPFHLDKTAAETSIFGGLVASGLMTAALSFRLWYGRGIMTTASLGSPGMDKVRWLAPVRPGDTIHVVVEVLEKRASRSKSDRGTVTLHYTVLNHRGEEVMHWTSLQLMKLRRPGDGETVAV